MPPPVDLSNLSDEELKAIAMGQTPPKRPDQLTRDLMVPEEPSPVVRMGRGMQDFYQGSWQKLLNWTDPAAANTYTQEVNEERNRYKAGMDTVGETGFDPFRFLGNVATPISAIPGGGASTLARLGIGAGIGGAAGYLGFNPTNTETGNLLNAGAGGLLGGTINAAAPAVLNAGMRGAQWLGNKVIEGGRSALQAITPQTNITNNVRVALQSRGVDWDKLVPEVQNAILDAGRDQLAKTGNLDAAMLARKADIEAIAGPGMGTLGQITRNPAQWTLERNLQRTEVNLPAVQRGEQGTITQRLADQDEALKRFGVGIYDSAYGGTPAEVRAATPYQASERTAEAVKGAYEKLGEEVSALYTTARQHLGAGAAVPTDAARGRITNAITDFEDVMPGPILARLREVGLDGRWQSKPTRELTVDEADKLLKLVNKRYASADTAGQAALNEVRGALKDAVLELGKGGNEAARKFMDAWSAASARFRQFEPKPLASIVDGQVNTANFLETQVLKGNPKDLIALRDVTTQNGGQAAWNDLRGQAWQWVMDKATQNGRAMFSGARYNDALKQIGQDRLAVLFPDELPRIMQLGRGSEAMTYQPGLAAVNTSNTTPAFIGQMLRLGNRVPGLNLLTAPISHEIENSATQRLIQGSLDASGATSAVREAAQAQARQRLLDGLLFQRSGYPALLAPAAVQQRR